MTTAAREELAPPAQAKRWLYPILLNVFLNTFGFGMIIPVMPELLAEITGESTVNASIHAGQLLFVFALFQFLLMPFFGHVSDLIGRRPIMIIAMAALVLDHIFMAAAQTLTLLYIGRIIAGAFGATHITGNAYITDICKGDERAKYFGYVGACMALGYMTGPLVGGLSAEISIRAPFILSAILSAINLGLIIVFLKESYVPDSASEKPVSILKKISWEKCNPFRFFSTLLFNTKIRPLLTVYTLIAIGHTAYTAVFAFVLIAKFGWSPIDIGLCLMAYGVAGLIGQGLLIDRAVKTLGTDKSILVGLIATLIGFALVAIAAHPIWVYVSVPVAAVSGIFGATLMSKMSAEASNSEQGEIQGVIGASQGLAMMVGPLVLTALFKWASPEHPVTAHDKIMSGAPFFLSTALCLAATLIYINQYRNRASIE